MLGFLFALVMAVVVYGSPAGAQGCGPQNPNCIVPTRPAGDSTNAAASTAFVTNAVSAPGGFSILEILGSSTLNAVASVNGTYAGAFTGAINWCPGWPDGCANGAAGGTWTAQQFMVGTTTGPPSNQESQLMSVVFANTGFYFVWAPTTSYSSGNYAVNGANMYTETVGSCTSAGSGGPTGTGSAIVDNTCRWNYVAPNYAGGKQAGNFNTIANAGGGHVWGLTAEAITNSGWNAQFAVGAEIDAGNFASIGTTFGVGPAQIYNLYLGGINSQPITAALYISPQGSASPAPAQYGIILNGTTAFSGASIFDNSTGAATSLIVGGSQTAEAISLASTASVGLNITGTYTTAINIPSVSNNSISFGGNIVAHGSNGVSCSGTPTSSFASVAGIVTHC